MGEFCMLTPSEELVRNWLVKAQHDLATARKAASPPDPYLDTAIYHCQQAAEKALKGFLAFNSQPLQRTHDIELLLSLASPLEPRFAAWLDAGERLTRYATLYRYPADVMEPDADEYDQALMDAEALYSLVLSLLPEGLCPSS
jgi:HEPN domain-containing protein